MVASFATPTEASACRSALESAGFEAALLDANLIGVDPALWPMIGGVKVAVPKADADEARALLKAIDSGLLLDSRAVALQCAACGSESVRFAGSAAAATYVCKRCGAAVE